jgi:lipid-A-disaccharide synthase
VSEFFIFKVMKIKIPFYSLPNLMEGKGIIPELVQKEATPENLAEETIALLVDDKRVARIKSDFANIRKKLGSPGVVRKVAEEVLKTAG